MANNRWHLLSVSAPPELTDIISTLLTDIGSEGVSISEGIDGLIDVNAYFPYSKSVDKLASQAAIQIDYLAEVFDISQVDINISEVSESEWIDNWKAYYHPTRITRHISIVPSWDNDYFARPGELSIRLDPETSFGTGTHPTTVLALYALEQMIRGGEVVIDVGTGSGVLAIAAALLGASSVIATDYDAAAVTIAKSNVLTNGLEHCINVEVKNLLEGIAQPELKDGAEIIVANILADVLLLLIDDAATLLVPGGHLILSGIYHDKFEAIAEKVMETGLEIVTQMCQGEWHCLVAHKP